MIIKAHDATKVDKQHAQDTRVRLYQPTKIDTHSTPYSQSIIYLYFKSYIANFDMYIYIFLYLKTGMLTLT